MKATFFAIAASALFSAASAGTFHERRNGHQAFHELKERDADVCQTVYTTWTGEAIWHPTPAPPAPTTSSVATTSSPAPQPTSAAPSSKAAEPSPSAAPAQGKGQDSNSNSGSSGSISTGGDLYAMSYTPYKGTSPGNSRCAEASEVSSDIAAIAAKGFKTIRSYATDCGGLQHIGDACKANGMKMIVGIFVDSSGIDSSEVNNQISDIKHYFGSNWSIVEMVLLGNEALFQNFVTADALASKLTSLKKDLASAGYNGPVSTADTLASLQEHEGTLCNAMDVLAANIHPFFNDATSAAGAGAFVAQQMQGLQSLCGGSKKVINSETGWPNNGDHNGAAIPSVADQLTAIKSIKDAAGGHSVFFSFENDMWKQAGYKSVEASWGCGSVFSG